MWAVVPIAVAVGLSLFPPPQAVRQHEERNHHQIHNIFQEKIGDQDLHRVILVGRLNILKHGELFQLQGELPLLLLLLLVVEIFHLLVPLKLSELCPQRLYRRTVGHGCFRFDRLLPFERHDPFPQRNYLALLRRNLCKIHHGARRKVFNRAVPTVANVAESCHEFVSANAGHGGAGADDMRSL
jgi:hypothetical protein